MEIYKEKQDQKLVPIYKFICLNFIVHCKNFTAIPFTLKFRNNFYVLSVPSVVCGGCISDYRRAQLINLGC